MDMAIHCVNIKDEQGKSVQVGHHTVPITSSYIVSASSLFRPRRFASRDAAGFFISTHLTRAACRASDHG
jgi:hypothetical protein